LAEEPDFTSYPLQNRANDLDLEGQRGSREQKMCANNSEDKKKSQKKSKESKTKSKKFKVNRRTISDAILGLSDGLTVPFALSAGLSTFGTTRLVILGGLAELVAGAISMGLGGFLGARSEL
jgi:vacuolar iron transporter family protein